MTERVVALVDMDCFYVQVEEREQPHLRGTPGAVVQYNTWRGGGIIAVNYEARAFGVKRGMRGDQAREKCANIQLFQVPVSRGKADLTKYREAGKEVIDVLVEFSDCIERASIDEAYVDLTDMVERQLAEATAACREVTAASLPSTWVMGHSSDSVEDGQGEPKTGLTKWLSTLYQEEEEEAGDVRRSGLGNRDNLRLAVAAVHCEEMRRAVFERTGFRCSAGIAHNKMLAKLACGLHKPNQQTVLPQEEVAGLWDSMPVGKIRNLGGKLGESVTERLGCVTMGDLARVSLSRLRAHYDPKTAHWLHNLGRGMDSEPVTARQLPKSIGCSKNFLGRETLDTPEKVRDWTRSLAEELSERLAADKEANKRCANTLTVGVRLDGDERWVSLNRSCRLPFHDSEHITHLALTLFQHTNTATAQSSVWSPAIKHISLSASKFEDVAGLGSANIQEMFRRAERKADSSSKVASTAPASTLLSPKTPSTTTTTTTFPRTPQPPLTTPFPSTTTSSSSSVSKRNFNDEEDVNTDHLETFEEASSKSEPLEATVGQSQTAMSTASQSWTPGTKGNQSEATSISSGSRVKVKQGSTSFPSQVGKDGGSAKASSGPTNSFFRNFLLQKTKTEKRDSQGGGSCGDDRKEGHHGIGGGDDSVSTINIDGLREVTGDGRVSADDPGVCDNSNEESEWSGREGEFSSESSPSRDTHSDEGGRRAKLSSETEVFYVDGDCEGDGGSGADNMEEGRKGELNDENCDTNEHTNDNSSSDLDILISVLDGDDDNGGMGRETSGGGGDGRKAVQGHSMKMTDSLNDIKMNSSHSPELFSSWEVEKAVEVMREKSSRHRKRARSEEREGTPKLPNRGTVSNAKDQRASGNGAFMSKGSHDTTESLSKDTRISAHRGAIVEAGTAGQGQGGSSKVSASQCKELARELFPNLDNIDATLLPLLPVELREEVEQQLARHSLRNAPPAEKPGSARAPPHQDSAGIMKYIQRSPKKPPTSRPRPTGALEGDVVECHECQEWVSAFELPEHLDYHLALRLQSELRQEFSGGGGDTARPTTSAVASPTKRGRKRGRRPAVDGKKIQKLDSFFTR